MKVVHLTTIDKGGAFKAVKRISESMSQNGIESCIFVRSNVAECDVNEIMTNNVQVFFSKARNFLNLLLSSSDLCIDRVGYNISKNHYIVGADVVVLHWINSFISPYGIEKLLKTGKKVIWVMHDMYPFTGGCHYSLDCSEQECRFCYMAKSKELQCSIRKMMKIKRRISQYPNMHYVAISSWEYDVASTGLGLPSNRISMINNPIDVSVFKPLDRETLRMEAELNGKKVVLFGADRMTDKVKGMQYIRDVIKRNDINNIVYMCFGADKEDYPEFSDVIFLGRIDDENELAKWYNVADVYLSTPVQEAFGYTICEALACGTPVVAHGIGGILDQVVHKENGYLTQVGDCDELVQGIDYCLQHKDDMRINAKKSVERLSYSAKGKEWLDLLTKK